jgi:hypothetical protein
MVKCAHGIMPVPAPATAEIVMNVPVKSGLVNHEATTPTGAAILVATVDEFSDKINFQITKTGYGIGNRDSEVPNVLRVFLCEDSNSLKDVNTEEAIVLESNIDDMNPEHYDFLLEKLFQIGASDAWISPVIMKKTRPAVTLSVLCKDELADKMKEVVFTNSTSIGIREFKVKKSMLRREEIEIETNYGAVKLKQSFFNGKVIRSKPEYEDCKNLAERHNTTISEIEKAVYKIIN